MKPLLGKMVEIIVVEEAPASVPADQDSGCFSQLAPPRRFNGKEEKALRALLTKAQFEALKDIVAEGGPDVDAIARLRGKSMT